MAVVLVAEQRRVQVAHFRPVVAPLGEDQRGHLVGERGLNFAQLAGLAGCLAGTAKQPVHQRQAEPRRDDQQADALERVGLEQRDVRRAGQFLGEFFVADDLHAGKLQAEFQPQKHGQPRGQRADKLLVPLLDATQFAGGEKSGLAKVMAADVAGATAFAHALGRQHKHVVGQLICFTHGNFHWMANSVK